MKYTIAYNGKSREMDAKCGFEMVARAEMCWHSIGSVFTISDNKGRCISYQKIAGDSISMASLKEIARHGF